MTSGEQEAAWRVVLDANILLQAPIRDTILRLAEAGVLAVLWSEAILGEVARNFAAVSGPDAAARRFATLRAALDRSFPHALTAGYDALLPSLSIAEHDRHVPACAIQAQADGLLTYNTRHFPERALAPYRLRVWHPDALLLDLLARFPATLEVVLRAQGGALHPPRSFEQVLAGLAREVPRFAAAARERLVG